MSAANAYAKAFYEVARDGKASTESSGDLMDLLEREMDTLQVSLVSSKEAQVALYGPITSSKEKGAIIEQLCRQLKLSDLLTRFALLLAKKGRLSLLQEIKDSFSSYRLTLEGGIAGQLETAEMMDAQDIGNLAKVFSQKLGKKVAFQVSTNPSLLAGMKVTVNGVTYDGTLRSQLQKLRDRFVTGLPGAHA